MRPTDKNPSCPECVTGAPLARRDFIRVLGTTAAVVAVGGLTPLQRATAARAAKQAEAEALVFELFATLSDDQKKKVVRAWDHGVKDGKGTPTRLGTANGAVDKLMIGTEYNKKQVELLDKVFHAISNGEEGYKQLSRNGRFDASNDFETIGALIYGEPVEGKKFSLVFTGHHITVRCDGNSEEKYAFGGPLYYGHTPNGYSDKNVFIAQTKAATELFRTIDDKQRAAAVKPGKWEDGVASVRLPKKGSTPPGLAYSAMTKEQREMTEKVMRQLIAPYRKEDGDEVMDIIKTNGGMEKLALAFYKEGATSDKEPWSHWRLEGPGFVWSFRALPHIHTFVNISSKLA